jgi:hypothetical protein
MTIWKLDFRSFSCLHWKFHPSNTRKRISVIQFDDSKRRPWNFKDFLLCPQKQCLNNKKMSPKEQNQFYVPKNKSEVYTTLRYLITKGLRNMFIPPSLEGYQLYIWNMKNYEYLIHESYIVYWSSTNNTVLPLNFFIYS